MATSAKQIAANQRNAKKSTGPHTPEGKAVASRNDPDDLDSDDQNTSRRDGNFISPKSVPRKSFRTSLQYNEMRLDRQLTRAYRLLNHLQNPQPPPIPKPKHKNTQNEPISTPPGGPAIGES
jgi:hypothetical protein